ncbi:MAG: hypothetical protein ACFE9C_08470 [Candidatus Hodarchaeota archaeon]
METNSIQIKPPRSSSHTQARCGICREEIRQGASIYREGVDFGVVCEQCYKKNSPKDLEFMAQLFKAYGGYFGKIKDDQFSLYDLITGMKMKSQPKDMNHVDIRLMHQALLHGITPHQLIQSLRILAD